MQHIPSHRPRQHSLGRATDPFNIGRAVSGERFDSPELIAKAFSFWCLGPKYFHRWALRITRPDWKGFPLASLMVGHHVRICFRGEKKGLWVDLQLLNRQRPGRNELSDLQSNIRPTGYVLRTGLKGEGSHWRISDSSGPDKVLRRILHWSTKDVELEIAVIVHSKPFLGACTVHLLKGLAC